MNLILRILPRTTALSLVLSFTTSDHHVNAFIPPPSAPNHYVTKHERMQWNIEPMALQMFQYSSNVDVGATSSSSSSSLLTMSATTASTMEESSSSLISFDSILLHQPVVWSMIIMLSIVSLLYIWETGVEYVREELPDSLQPVIEKILGEISGLGFIGVRSQW
jgi:hypothetical protein